MLYIFSTDVLPDTSASKIRLDLPENYAAGSTVKVGKIWLTNDLLPTSDYVIDYGISPTVWSHSGGYADPGVNHVTEFLNGTGLVWNIVGGDPYCHKGISVNPRDYSYLHIEVLQDCSVDLWGHISFNYPGIGLRGWRIDVVDQQTLYSFPTDVLPEGVATAIRLDIPEGGGVDCAVMVGRVWLE